ncbi:MAG TPA: hypothetical protein VMJ10_30290 [Kofleriaceae bacterium]|nr:hypothetical protein [Kofleriaceae bacterium]
MSARLKVVALRFGVIFGALQVAPFPLDWLPKLGTWVSEQVTAAWSWIDATVGAWFGLDVVRHPTGSGDTLADYVQLAICFVVALVAALAWTVARPRSLAHPRIAACARVGLRYYLGATMLSYGFAKIFPSQFGYAADTNLYAQIGHKSPMGMLWTFMAVSRPYQVFGGAMETIGGLLLFWRRTTLLGALVVLAVMTNVVALNFCYDVAVKLYSSELLVGAIILVAPDARRLVTAIFARTDEPVLNRRVARWLVKYGAAAMFLVMSTYEFATQPSGPERRDVYGVWDVVRFERDGIEVPARAFDPARWRVVAFRSTAMVRTADGEDHFHRVSRDDDERLELGDDGRDGSFAIAFRDEGPTLTGRYDGHALVVELRRTDPTQMPLLTRGFNWIQEYPFNR